MQVITRVVWAVCWTPDSLRFLTASRDKRLVAWGQLQHGGKWEQVGLHSSFFSLTYLEVEQYIQRDIGDIVVVTIPTDSVHCAGVPAPPAAGQCDRGGRLARPRLPRLLPGGRGPGQRRRAPSYMDPGCVDSHTCLYSL